MNSNKKDGVEEPRLYHIYNTFFILKYESSETIKNTNYNYGKFLKMKNKTFLYLSNIIT